MADHYLPNRFRDLSYTSPPADSTAHAFHLAIRGYRPTPLHHLTGLAESLGLADLVVKDESNRFGLPAFKVLGASWAVERLRRTRGNLPSTLTTASAGNFGRALAWTARRAGCRAVIYLSEQSAPARVAAIQAEGADTILVPGTYDDAVVRCAAESVERGWQVVSDTGYPGYLDIPAWIEDGYGTLGIELEEQLADKASPDVVLIQGGVGGLAAAVVRTVRRWVPAPGVVVVEPEDADCLWSSAASPNGVPTASTGAQRTRMAGLNCREASLTAWPTLRAGVDGFLRISDSHAETAMRRLARPRASDPTITAGESGAAGVGALLALCADPAFAHTWDTIGVGPDCSVLVVVTEGATDPEGYARVLADP